MFTQQEAQSVLPGVARMNDDRHFGLRRDFHLANERWSLDLPRSVPMIIQPDFTNCYNSWMPKCRKSGSRTCSRIYFTHAAWMDSNRCVKRKNIGPPLGIRPPGPADHLRFQSTTSISGQRPVPSRSLPRDRFRILLSALQVAMGINEVRRWPGLRRKRPHRHVFQECSVDRRSSLKTCCGSCLVR